MSDYDDLTEEVYEVEAIVGSRVVDGIEQYHVKWVGWEDPTWEPIENLTGCMELVRAYKRKSTVKEEIKPPEPKITSKTDQFRHFIQSSTLALKPGGFIGCDRIDTSNLDNNWYIAQPAPVITSKLHITGIKMSERGKLVTVSGEGGIQRDYDYDTIAALFPNALFSFIESHH